MTFLCKIAYRKKNGSPYLSFIVRQCKWPSLSRKVFEIQKTCFHGNRMLSLGITTRNSMVTECLALELQRTIALTKKKKTKNKKQKRESRLDCLYLEKSQTLPYYKREIGGIPKYPQPRPQGAFPWLWGQAPWGRG